MSEPRNKSELIKQSIIDQNPYALSGGFRLGDGKRKNSRSSVFDDRDEFGNEPEPEVSRDFTDESIKIDLLNISDKLIRFNYQVNVKAHIFSDAAKKYFMKNVLNAVSQHELIELNRFNEFYENVKATEYYDLYHQQGKRLKLFKNEILR